MKRLSSARFAAAFVVSLAAVPPVATVACNSSSGPPPRQAEVPMYEDPPPLPPPQRPPPSPDPTTESAPPPSAPPSASSSAKAPATSGKLTLDDCTRLMDKSIALLAVEQGISEDQLPAAMGMLRSVAGSDPNYKKALVACQKENTRPQYNCAMGANSTDTWKNCLK